jgi:hypothetical protein
LDGRVLLRVVTSLIKIQLFESIVCWAKVDNPDGNVDDSGEPVRWVEYGFGWKLADTKCGQKVNGVLLAV